MDHRYELFARCEQSFQEVKWSIDTLIRSVDRLTERFDAQYRTAAISNPGSEYATPQSGGSFEGFGRFGMYPYHTVHDPQPQSHDPRMVLYPEDQSQPFASTAEPELTGPWVYSTFEPSTTSRVQAGFVSPESVDNYGGQEHWHYGGRSEGNDLFPGGGHDSLQSTHRWPEVPAQQAEASTSLVAAKPDIIDYDNRSEQSSIPSGASSSRRKFNRADSAKEKQSLFTLISRELNIPLERDEVVVLRTAIEYLGGTVPLVPEPEVAVRRAQAKRDKTRRAYFGALEDCVGPLPGRFSERKVLDRALRALQGVEHPDFGEKCKGFGLFRA